MMVCSQAGREASEREWLAKAANVKGRVSLLEADLTASNLAAVQESSSAEAQIAELVGDVERERRLRADAEAEAEAFGDQVRGARAEAGAASKRLAKEAAVRTQFQAKLESSLLVLGEERALRTEVQALHATSSSRLAAEAKANQGLREAASTASALAGKEAAVRAALEVDFEGALEELHAEKDRRRQLEEVAHARLVHLSTISVLFSWGEVCGVFCRECR
jgi:hypothetical protein